MHPRVQLILFLLQVHLPELHFLVLQPQVSSSIHADGTASDVIKMGMRLSPLRLWPDSSGSFMQGVGKKHSSISSVDVDSF